MADSPRSPGLFGDKLIFGTHGDGPRVSAAEHDAAGQAGVLRRQGHRSGRRNQAIAALRQKV